MRPESPFALDAASAEELAHRVVAWHAERSLVDDSALADAADVARRFDVDRSCVYAYAPQLGARRLGPGRHAGLRFHLRVVAEALAAGLEDELAAGSFVAEFEVRGPELAGVSEREMCVERSHLDRRRYAESERSRAAFTVSVSRPFRRTAGASPTSDSRQQPS